MIYYQKNQDRENQQLYFQENKRIIKYLNIDGSETDEKPKIQCGIKIVNEITSKSSFYIRTCDGQLYHPVSSMRPNSIKMLKVNESLYNRYQNFLSKKNEITYNQLQRDICAI